MPIQNSISNTIKGSIINGGGPAADFSTKSLSFDGVDDYVEVADADSLSFGNGTTDLPFSISAWVKLGSTSTMGIVSKYGASSSTREWLFYTSAGKPRILLIDKSNSTNAFAEGNTALSTNTFYHITCTYDGRGGSTAYQGLNIYVDGVLQSLTVSGTSYTAMHNTSQPVEIGKYQTQNFNGNIDEVSIFNSELSASDITTIYNNGKPADLTSLNPLAWYRAGENSTFSYPQILMPENTNKDKVSKYSLAFDGTSDYIDCGDADEFSFGNSTSDSPFSLSAWVKISNFNSAHIIFEKRDYINNNNDFEYVLAITSAGGINNNIYDNNTLNRRGRKTSDGLISLNTWYHIAMTYNGVGGTNASDGIKTYLNGVRVDNANNQKNTYTAMHNTNQPFKIGRILAGNIDEASVFNIELSSTDVTNIYNSGVPSDLSSYSPVGYWKLGEEAKFTDNWLVPNSSLSNFSKYSFNFDGTDDYINCGNNANLQPTTEISVSAWFKTSSLTRQTIASRTYYRLRLGLTGELEWAVFDSAATGVFAITSGVNYADNQWHNVVCTHQTNGRSKIYVDGTLQVDIAGLTTNVFNTSIEFLIGRRNFSVTQFFVGNIDEVAVWTSELSAAAVTAIYNGGKPKDLSGLSPVSWWRMGEEATYDGTTNQFTIPDQGSGGNTGTSSNTMLLETLVGDTPQYYGGGISDSMDIFDRVGDAPNSENNTVSFNMEEADIVEDTP